MPALVAFDEIPARSSDCSMGRTRLAPPPSYWACCRLCKSWYLISTETLCLKLSLQFYTFGTYFWQAGRPNSRMGSKCRNNLSTDWSYDLLLRPDWSYHRLLKRVLSLSAEVTANALLFFLISWLHPPSLESKRKTGRPHFQLNDIRRLLCGQKNRAKGQQVVGSMYFVSVQWDLHLVVSNSWHFKEGLCFHATALPYKESLNREQLPPSSH